MVRTTEKLGIEDRSSQRTQRSQRESNRTVFWYWASVGETRRSLAVRTWMFSVFAVISVAKNGADHGEVGDRRQVATEDTEITERKQSDSVLVLGVGWRDLPELGGSDLDVLCVRGDFGC